MQRTYRDPRTGGIFTEDGRKIDSYDDYVQRVRKKEISGIPQDVSQMPKIQRTADGGLLTSMSGLDKFKNNTQFYNTVKDLIQQKQRIQEPLSEAKSYWRTLRGDTSPFGGVRDSALPGTFTNEEMRKLSPSDQASIRSSRNAAANANLRGIEEREIAQKTRQEDIINSMTNYQEQERKVANDALTRRQKEFDLEKDKQDLTGIVDARALGYKNAVDNRVGGSVSWRNNNPGNIKFSYKNGQMSGLAKRLLESGVPITQGSPAADGGSFINFPDKKTGVQAMKDLITGNTYANLTLDQALKKWSNNGYGAEIIPDIGSKTTMNILAQHPELLNDVVNQMIKREGWAEGQVVGEEQQPLTLTDAKKVSLMQDAGLTNQDVANYTEDEWIELENTNREAYYTEALELLQTGDGRTGAWKNLPAEEVYSKLQRRYGNKLSPADLTVIMKQAGAIKKGTYDDMGNIVYTWQFSN